MEHPRPDNKNWTWVLERPCPTCHYDAGTIARDMIGATLRTTVEAWRAVLSRGALVRQRPPGPATRGPIWSALEYGCHVRDVFVLFAERLQLPVFSAKNPPVHVPGKGPQSLAGAPPRGDAQGRSGC
jgi:hypothetical protein